MNPETDKREKCYMKTEIQSYGQKKQYIYIYIYVLAPPPTSI